MAQSTLFDRYFTPAKEIPRKVELGTGAVIALIILSCWAMVSYTGFISEDFLPSPSSVWQSFVKKVSNGSLQEHIGVSLVEIYLGFFLSSIVAVPIGIFMGGFRIVSAAIEPVVISCAIYP